MARDCDCEPVGLVAGDVDTVLGAAFPAAGGGDGDTDDSSAGDSRAGDGGGFRVHPSFVDEAIESSRFTTVVWEYAGVHRRAFAGLAPTGRPVHINGVTLVEHAGGGRHLFHRYVDWAAVMGQLGLSASFRPAVAELAGRPSPDRPPSDRPN